MSHLTEDLEAATVTLSAPIMVKLDELVNQNLVVGPRYNAQNCSEVDTENIGHF